MSLSFTEQEILSVDFGGVSSVPPLTVMKNVQNMTQTALDEDDELFIGYGQINTSFPYRMQNMYGRELKLKKYRVAILENKYLKAVFLPDFGGRMWSLYDKIGKRDLLYTNSAIRPGNLGVRNAWVAGGIEYNIGIIGHGPFTCDTMFTAQTALSDGTPVLRFYEFERIRNVVYQMDFFLPEDSGTLFGRMRVVNPSTDAVPMYWWTNMAVPGDKQSRDVVDADEAYTNIDYRVSKCKAPKRDNIDITYPANNPFAVDYFWRIPDGKRKYTAFLDQDGNGFVQHSTARLKGRKLFVWGQGKGGTRWQRFLTGDGHDGKYFEIQAGLARTQYESIPMPPQTAWEWLEGYSALSVLPEKVHGDWHTARDSVADALNGVITEADMERILKETHAMATAPAQKTIITASGWGKLENMRRASDGLPLMTPYLDFGEVGAEQKMWVDLLETGELGKEQTISWIWQKEWTDRLLNAAPSALRSLELAAIMFAERDYAAAKQYADDALAECRTTDTLFVASQVYRQLDDMKAAVALAAELAKSAPEDISVIRQVFETVDEAGDYLCLTGLYESLSEKLQADGRIKLYYCRAVSELGDPCRAFGLLTENGGVSVADLREGDNIITEIYLAIKKAAAEKSGNVFDETEPVPEQFDFRMQA